MKIFLIILALMSFSQMINACDMFAVISLGDSTLAMQDTVAGKFNDLLDFFDFIKLRSDIFIQNDGYGSIYYKRNDYTIDSTQTWYKTGYNTWYGDGKPDPLDDAINTIINPENNAFICMTHARDGTAADGSHPFLFQYNGRTYSFMHNGSINGTLKRAIMNFLGEDWFVLHPSNWYGEYPDANSFIDSELLFHYLMRYIINDNDVVSGIKDALNNTDLGGINFKDQLRNAQFIFNFVLSDGEHLYAFRNSLEWQTNFNLSYSLIANRFYAIKTDETLDKSAMQPMTLLKLSSNESPVLCDMDEPLSVILKDFSASYMNESVMISWSTYSESDIAGWNLYHNFTDFDFYSNNTQKLNLQLIETTGDNSNYEFKDETDFEVGQKIYYWIEAIKNNGDILSFDPVKVTISDGSHDDEENQTLLYGNFPNPFRESSKIRFTVESSAVLQIYNIKGQLIYSKNYSKGDYSVDTPKLSNGLYLYRLKSGYYDKIKKMIKIK